MPMVWRVLVTLDRIKSRFTPDLCVEDLSMAYLLRSHGNNRFLLFSTSKNPLILRATKNEEKWKQKFFFLKRDSITGGFDLLVKWLTSANLKELAPPSAESEQRIKSIYQLSKSERTFSLSSAKPKQGSSSEMFVKAPEVFDLDELDSYPAPLSVKKEPSPNAITSSKSSGSKAVATSKFPLASRTRAASARKRKETDSPAVSETFPFENHGFNEASGFMTSFLNQVKTSIRYPENVSCGLIKMLEVKLEKAEVTIADQRTIAVAKSQHYEDKFKAMIKEHQATLHKAN
ncbi:hypothetical protein Hanom_Chr00s001241g01677491 [Helianthus anomalus]